MAPPSTIGLGRVGRCLSHSPQRAQGVGEVPLSTTPQIPGRRSGPQSRFPAWVESDTFQKKKKHTQKNKILIDLEKRAQGTDKEYQTVPKNIRTVPKNIRLSK